MMAMMPIFMMAMMADSSFLGFVYDGYDGLIWLDSSFLGQVYDGYDTLIQVFFVKFMMAMIP